MRHFERFYWGVGTGVIAFSPIILLALISRGWLVFQWPNCLVLLLLVIMNACVYTCIPARIKVTNDGAFFYIGTAERGSCSLQEFLTLESFSVGNISSIKSPRFRLFGVQSRILVSTRELDTVKAAIAEGGWTYC